MLPGERNPNDLVSLVAKFSFGVDLGGPRYNIKGLNVHDSNCATAVKV